MLFSLNGACDETLCYDDAFLVIQGNETVVLGDDIA